MKYKVLIVDDHRLFNEGLALLLKESNQFEVVGQLYDSRDCNSCCHRLNPDLVLLDYNMPHKDGMEVAKELKQLVHKPKIVIVTMYSNHDEVELFKELGVDGFITKTTPAEQLISSLLEILKGQKVFDKKAGKSLVDTKDNFDLKNKFTKREMDILMELKKGKSTLEVANSLNLSFFTIETHRKNINKKLSFNNKPDFYKFLSEL